MIAAVQPPTKQEIESAAELLEPLQKPFSAEEVLERVGAALKLRS